MSSNSSVATSAGNAQGDLLPVTEQPSTNVALARADTSFVEMIERLASNPSVDVAKIERIIDMQERVLRFNAEAAFNEAFAAMQPDIPVIVEKHSGDSGKWSFAPLEDIVTPLRPVLAKHGFSISHQTEWPDAKTVKVIGILTHRGGHSRKSEFQAAADNTGSKNTIQSFGSTVAYGRRYTTKDLLCIVTRGEDDDADTSNLSESPEGFADWFADLRSAAETGVRALEEMWAARDPKSIKFKNHLAEINPSAISGLRKQAKGRENS